MRNANTRVRTRNPELVSSVRHSQLAFEIFFQGKWRIHILWFLRNGPVRIGELGRLIPGASKKTLAQHLRRLEADGIIIRTDMSDLVLHVEYKLSPSFEKLVCDLLDSLSEAGALYLSETDKHVGLR